MIDFFSTLVNFSVCVALCALAIAGASSAPVVPTTTAALAATMDLRIFTGFLLMFMPGAVYRGARRWMPDAGQRRVVLMIDMEPGR
jgi:hypothetical protein